MVPLMSACTLITCVALTHAARLTVSIPPSSVLANPATLPPSTHAVLLGPPGVRYDVQLRRDNTFILPDLEDASYLLTLHSRDYFFPPLRIDVGPGQTIDAWQTFRGNEWSNKGPHYGSAKDELTIQLAPSGRKEFYQERGGFSLLGFVKSPMILMSLFSAVMVFGMPYLMENMDPETKAEFEDIQKNGPLIGSSGAASQIQNFDLANWMAGRSSGTDGAVSGGGEQKK